MEKVQLYVYDLSNGLARQMSLQLTGKQIDGIWHTSVVVFGKEIFYGQGVCVTKPGQSHHGRPLHILDMGNTALDEETFQEYLNEMRQHYTADKYHLLDFNCNSFTNDVVGFLTGGSIPSWIKDLPSDFLSTPFGAALRPTIDNLYRPAAAAPVSAAGAGGLPAPGGHIPAETAAAALMQAAASTNGTNVPASSSGLRASESLTGTVHVSTNPASLSSLLSSHRAAAVLFTAPATCPPCRIVDPAFEQLAREKDVDGMAFVKVDLDVGRGRECAAAWSIRATPTIIFFFDGQRVAEVKGASLPEIKTQVDLLVYQLYPPHPHTQLKLPAIQGISLKPILYTQVPDLNVALSKLLAFLDGVQPSEAYDTAQATKVLRDVVPHLGLKTADALQNVAAITPVLQSWSSVTVDLVRLLPPEQLFPLVDLWRVALISPKIGSTLSSSGPLCAGIDAILTLASAQAAPPRTLILTTLRMAANLFSSPELSRGLLLAPARREQLVSWVVTVLLSEDPAVRTAAASLTFNMAAACQKEVREALEKRMKLEGGQDWEVEMVSALVEAINSEVSSEDVVHRLAASLALFLYLSPVYQSQLTDLLEVLQAKQIVLSKLAPGGCGEKGVQKKDVRALLKELADALCP